MHQGYIIGMNNQPIIASDGNVLYFDIFNHRLGLREYNVSNLSTSIDRQMVDVITPFGNQKEYITACASMRVDISLVGVPIDVGHIQLPNRNIYTMSVLEILEEVNRRV